jgi:hypothetical protein
MALKKDKLQTSVRDLIDHLNKTISSLKKIDPNFTAQWDININIGIGSALDNSIESARHELEVAGFTEMDTLESKLNQLVADMSNTRQDGLSDKEQVAAVMRGLKVNIVKLEKEEE